MKYFEKIKGERLYLSPMNSDDVETYTKWLNDKEVTENIGYYTKNFSINAENKK